MPDLKSASSNRIDLISILRELPDSRVERTRLHKLEDILLIAICALLCGAESFEDMELFGDTKEPWLRTFLELPHGIPATTPSAVSSPRSTRSASSKRSCAGRKACAPRWPMKSSPSMAKPCAGPSTPGRADLSSKKWMGLMVSLR